MTTLPLFVREIVDELYGCHIGCNSALCSAACVCPCHEASRAIDCLHRVVGKIAIVGDVASTWPKLRQLLNWAKP